MFSALIRRLMAHAQLLAISSRTSQLLAALSVALAINALVNAKELLFSFFEALTRTADWSKFFHQHYFELASAVGSALAWALKNTAQYNITKRYVMEDFYKDEYGKAIRLGMRNTLKAHNPELVIEKTNDGEAISSPRLNRYLAKAPFIPISINPTPWRAYDHYSGGDGLPDTESRLINLLRFVVLHGARRGDFIFNRSKIKLATDLFCPALARTSGNIVLFNQVTLRRTDYFSSVITDGLAFKRISSYPELSSFHLSDGLSSFLATYNPTPETAQLLSLERARSASQLGATTIAFSRDGRAVLNRVSFRTRYGAGRVSSSGSGSMSWRDIQDSGCRDLLDVVKYSALRKLTDECGLGHGRSFKPNQVQADVLILAFYRLIHRGGKPEFFCIGYIDADYEEIVQRRLRFFERLFTAKIDVPDTPTVNLTSQTLAADIARECERFLRKREAEQSLGAQLYLGLRFLSNVVNDSTTSNAITKFFKEKIEKQLCLR